MSQIATIRAALEELPAQCRYHGDATEPPANNMFRREACCDTGVPAQRRKKAEQALLNLATDPVTVNIEGLAVKDVDPKQIAEDIALAAGWPRLARDDRTVREEHLDGVPYLVVPEKAKDLLLEYGWTPPADDDASVDQGVTDADELRRRNSEQIARYIS
jgi:hypothetical protein